ncbi:hypothetical protein NNJEOMEG_03325 [Fundidesulfovibrio magnetotacticus]|uniref:Site-specific DNA-methyltransferase (adenine-specific) n=1 Tax=Fundidesulfovibrio magnetotacticus TaxID=2730080 RepID=A0A6V8LSK5_9BACT|nr:DNA adenine methylase [Fundidesulfovibrio magnetotacticus]GFK95462.1 hypothetical protein NNJEOMEG_03325 [Fundidesulfovibrio magnetotacticus]
MNTSPSPSRPVLRYHGGKSRLALWIIGHFPAHRVYVEPYGGAASVLMRKSPTHCDVYNDLDASVVNVFRVLRDSTRARELERLLRLTPFSRVEFERAQEPCADPVEQARRTVIRMAMGMGSDAIHRKRRTGFRSRREGDRSPAHDFAAYPQLLECFSHRLRTVTVEMLPALEVIERYDGGRTLFYVDPPYVHSQRTQVAKGGGYAHEMTDTDHEALSERLHAVEGMVVLSGYDSELYRRLYPDWPVFRRRVMADKAVPRVECLWLSPWTAAKLDRRSTLLEVAG